MARSRQFVGRQQEFELVDGHLGLPGRRAVVVGGRAGVGKTRLATEIAASWRSRGLSVDWVSATTSSAEIPFGAVARLLGPASADDLDARERAAGLVRQVVAQLRSDPERLLVVDDGHLLDDLSAMLVQQVALDGAIPLVVTVRTGERAPAALETLWRDHHAERVDLLPLSQAESAEMLHELLGGAVESGTATALYSASEGNPLFLAQLVADALDAGALTGEGREWRWDGSVGRARQISEAVGDRLDASGAPGRRMLTYVAVGEPVGLSSLTELCPDVDLEDAERRGLVRIDVDGKRLHVRLGHPLFGEVLLGRQPPTMLSPFRLELAAMISATGRRRGQDLLAEASLRLAGGDVSAGELYERAAERALLLGDLTATQRFARAAGDCGGSVIALVLLGEALLGQLELTEAVDALGRALEVLHDDPLLVRVAFDLHQAHHHLGDEKAAETVVRDIAKRVQDPTWSAVLEGELAQNLVFRGRTREGGMRAEALLEQWQSEPRVRLRLLGSAGSVRALGGRTAAALALSEGSLADALALQDEMPMAPSWVMGVQLQGLLLAGRLADATGFIALLRGMQASGRKAGAAPAGTTFLDLYAGRLAIAQGDAATAVRHLSAASAEYSHADVGGLLRWCLSLEAEARALADDLDGARDCARRAELAESKTLTYDGDARRARAWVTAASGQLTDAIVDLLDLAALQRLEEQHLLAAVSLHDAVRLGGLSEAGPALIEVLPLVDGAWSEAIGVHIAALRTGEGAHLESAGEAFATMGANLYAAEAMATAALAFDGERLPARAANARRRLDELLAACGRPRSPALAVVSERVALTRREREVVELAATGISSRAIAERLFVSERTAEGHLYRAMVKLGVTNRSDLTRERGEGTPAPKPGPGNA